MSSKSRRSRGKRLAKKRIRPVSPVAAQPGPAPAQAAAPASASAPRPLASAQASAPRLVETTTAPAAVAARHAMVVTELRRVGILGGIMLVVLVVLALALS